MLPVYAAPLKLLEVRPIAAPHVEHEFPGRTRQPREIDWWHFQDLRTDLRVRVPTFRPYNVADSPDLGGHGGRAAVLGATCRHTPDTASGTYTIFEGTSEIQRLVIARAISGVHIR